METEERHTSRKILWGIFGWRGFFRWDVLGAIIPGVFIAVGLGLLSVDWFPNNLLISQLCLSVAGLLCTAKLIGQAVESSATVRSRVFFAIVVSSMVIGLTFFADLTIEHHKLLTLAEVQGGKSTRPDTSAQAQPHQAASQSTTSQADPHLREEIISELRAQLNANQLSSISDERIDEMMRLAVRSLSEYESAWSDTWFQIAHDAEDEKQVPPGTKARSREEMATITANAKKKQAALDAKNINAVQPLLNPVSAVLKNIYQHRLTPNQQTAYRSEYDETQGRLKRIDSWAELARLVNSLEDFEHLLKANLHA